MARRKKAAAEQELDGLAEDWVALWQSEIAGLMADPELAAAWGSMAAMGTAWLRALTSGLQGAAQGYPFARPQPDEPAATPPRPAPAAAAPDAGRKPRQRRAAGQPGAAAPKPGMAPSMDPGMDPGAPPGTPGGTGDAARLADRLAELERRLAEVELRPAGGRAHRRGTGRRRPSA